MVTEGLIYHIVDASLENGTKCDLPPLPCPECPILSLKVPGSERSDGNSCKQPIADVGGKRSRGKAPETTTSDANDKAPDQADATPPGASTAFAAPGRFASAVVPA